MRTDNQRRSTNVEDRRGQPVPGGARVSGAGVALILRLLFSRAGRRFILPLIAIGVVAYLFVPQFRSAVDSALQGGAPQSTPLDPETEARFEDEARAVLGSTEDVWSALFRADGETYPEPTLVFYTGAVESACGFATAAVGPFYCPGDRKLYLDLGFFTDMETQLGAPGDFAQAYVIAHEIGHHVQNLEGVLADAQRQQNAAGQGSPAANRVQVRVELMADCLAGVWAGEAERRSEIVIEPGDVQEAIDAAAAVGDDTLQRRATGTVRPDAFTHGTSAQRMAWFQQGFDSRDPDVCAEAQTVPESRL
jgi:predicted metalloprotease